MRRCDRIGWFVLLIDMILERLVSRKADWTDRGACDKGVVRHFPARYALPQRWCCRKLVASAVGLHNGFDACDIRTATRLKNS
ncbi:MAG: hypothetical protein D6741_04865 [Planctomycetota bacterium]|nr:MAG: hypothetical protein D6741_04865 [Planctomycetota bacterium]